MSMGILYYFNDLVYVGAKAFHWISERVVSFI